MELTVGEVQVRVCVDDNSGTYHFDCPGCELTVVKPAEPRVIDLLVASGVEMSTWELPAELREERGGAPLTHDDLIDFHRLLASDDWFEQLTADRRLGD